MSITAARCVELYHEGVITESELTCQLVRRFTPDNVVELLAMLPDAESLSRIRAHAASDLPMRSFHMGSFIRREGDTTDPFKEESEAYGRGLAVFRDYLKAAEGTCD